MTSFITDYKYDIVIGTHWNWWWEFAWRRRWFVKVRAHEKFDDIHFWLISPGGGKGPGISLPTVIPPAAPGKWKGDGGSWNLWMHRTISRGETVTHTDPETGKTKTSTGTRISFEPDRDDDSGWPNGRYWTAGADYEFKFESWWKRTFDKLPSEDCEIAYVLTRDGKTVGPVTTVNRDGDKSKTPDKGPEVDTGAYERAKEARKRRGK